MSDYLRPIVEDYDPLDYGIPTDEEVEEAKPENPTEEEIMDVMNDLRDSKQVGGAVMTGKILVELLHLSTQVRNRIEEINSSSVTEWDREQKDDVHLFFAFVGQVQEYLLREAVVTHIIQDEVTTDRIKEKIMSGDRDRAMSARECIDYLHRGGVIDDGLKGEIGQVRGERNETVHDITRWFFAHFDPEELESQVSRGERSVVRLLELVYGFDLE